MFKHSVDIFEIKPIVDNAVILNINDLETFCIIQDDVFSKELVFFVAPDLKEILVTITSHSYQNNPIAAITWFPGTSKSRVVLMSDRLVQTALNSFRKQSPVLAKYAVEIKSYLATKSAEGISKKLLKITPRNSKIRTIEMVPDVIPTLSLPILRTLDKITFLHQTPLATIPFSLLHKDYCIIRNHIEINTGDTYVDTTWHKTSTGQILCLDWINKTIYFQTKTDTYLSIQFEPFANLVIIQTWLK